MRRFVIVLLFISIGCFSKSVDAQSSKSEEEVARALLKSTRQLGDHTYELRYKFAPGQSVAYNVEHLVRVKTTISGEQQSQASRSKSRKVWKVKAVDGEQAVFTHTIDFVNMWSESDGRTPVKYDSRDDEEAPPEYASVAEILGKPLTTVRVDTRGQVLDRKDSIDQVDFGTGGLMMPLPEKPLGIGGTWSVERDVPVRQEDGSFKAIKTRQRYRLERVASGIATISMKTQILTPSISARARSQLIQKLSNGEILFDIDSGRVVSRKLDWDETVVGFNGPKSNMVYLGRIAEELVTQRVARKD